MLFNVVSPFSIMWHRASMSKVSAHASEHTFMKTSRRYWPQGHFPRGWRVLSVDSGQGVLSIFSPPLQQYAPRGRILCISTPYLSRVCMLLLYAQLDAHVLDLINLSTPRHPTDRSPSSQIPPTSSPAHPHASDPPPNSRPNS